MRQWLPEVVYNPRRHRTPTAIRFLGEVPATSHAQWGGREAAKGRCRVPRVLPRAMARSAHLSME